MEEKVCRCREEMDKKLYAATQLALDKNLPERKARGDSQNWIRLHYVRDHYPELFTPMSCPIHGES